MAIKDELSLAIFATSGMYIERVHFVGLSMLIQRVLTFCKILFPFTFINLQALKTQSAFFGYEKNMNTAIEANLLCTSQQGYEIKFTTPN
jgi:hypothetical protein